MKTLFVLALSLTGCLKDIRPAKIVDAPPTSTDEQRGRQLLTAMAEAHGVDAWQAAERIRMELVDHWPSRMLRGFGTPLREPSTKMELSFVPGSGFEHEFRWLDGRDAGNGVAASGGSVFAVDDGVRTEKTSMKYRVYGPATQYLWELPFRISADAGLATWVRPGVEAKRPVDLVLVTWESYEPHADADQYLLYIDQHDRRLLRSDYTVRDGGRFFASTVWFEDYRDVGGFVLPQKMRVDQFAPFKVAPLHQSEVLEVEVIGEG